MSAVKPSEKVKSYKLLFFSLHRLLLSLFSTVPYSILIKKKEEAKVEALLYGSCERK